MTKTEIYFDASTTTTKKQMFSCSQAVTLGKLMCKQILLKVLTKDYIND